MGSFKLKFALILLCLMYASSSYALAPPEIAVKDALLNGHVAFWGRVIKLRETKRLGCQTEAEAYMQIKACLYGLDCEKTRYVTLHFVSETVVPTALPVSFDLSTEFLVILNRPATKEMQFDSDARDGWDMAYVVCDTFPEGYHKSEELRLLNIYMQVMSQRISKEELAAWAKERARQLEEGD